MSHGFSGSKAPIYYRSVFLSDFHMGAKRFDAQALLDFLKSFHCEKLYLVGDIIDGWKLNKRWYWTEECSQVIDELVRKSAKGTKIYYLPGNHDEEVRRVLPMLRHRFSQKLGIKIKDKIVHHTADGRKFLVLHGDQFDRKILRGPLSKWSDRVYDIASELAGAYIPKPKIRIAGKLKPFSLAKSLNKHSQKALHLLNNFENAVLKTVTQKGLNGLICGHTHIPVIKNIKNITYANAGSWTSNNHTALIETEDGQLEIIDWPSSFTQPLLSTNVFATSCRLVPNAQRFRPVTEQILFTIRKVWPVKHAFYKGVPTQDINPFKPVTALLKHQHCRLASAVTKPYYFHSALSASKATLRTMKNAPEDLIALANPSVQLLPKPS